MKCFSEVTNNSLPPSLWLNKAEQWMGKMKLDGGEGPCMPWGWRAQAPGWEKPANSYLRLQWSRNCSMGMCPKQLSKAWTRRYKYLLKVRVLALSWGGTLHRNPLKTKGVTFVFRYFTEEVQHHICQLSREVNYSKRTEQIRIHSHNLPCMVW